MTNGVPSGVMLLKTIIEESHLDSSATVLSIRRKLTTLHQHLPTLGHDIDKFNRYVQTQVRMLHARQEQTQDLLMHLFKAYSISSDCPFVDYIRRREDEYTDGKSFTPDELMNSARNKYMQLKELGKWNALTASDRKLLALEAKVAKMSKKNDPDKDNGTEKKTRRSKKKQEKEDKPSTVKEWLAQQKPPPKNKMHQVRVCNIGDKPRRYNWCSSQTGGHCDGRWVMHKPEDCLPVSEYKKQWNKRGKGPNKREQKQQPPAVDKKKLRVAEALASITENASDSDE